MRSLLAVLAIPLLIGCGGEGAQWDTVTGYITIGRACDDLGEHTDLASITPTLRDSEGMVLAEMHTPSGGVTLGDSCLIIFIATDVDKRDRYTLDLGERGSLDIERHDIVERGVEGIAKFFDLTIG